MQKSDVIKIVGARISSEILKIPGKIITEDQPLISSGLIDSFSLVDLALLIEDSFGVRIEDFELNANTFDTLGQLAEIILSRSDK
jgi:acyl carrier protein